MGKVNYSDLEKKYTSSKNPSAGKKEMNIMGRGNRGAALNARGKPKNLKKTVIRLLKYLSHERVLFITAAICAIVYTISSLAASYMLRPVMNKFIYFDGENSDISLRLKGLLGGILLMALVYAVSLITHYLQQRLMLTVSQNSLKRMRKELFDKIQTLPIKYFDTHQTGDIMSRFTNDVDTVGEMLNTTLIQIISGALTVFGTIVLMLYTNFLLGMITIVMTPVLTLVTKTIVKKSRSAYSLQQKNLGMLNAYAEEMITGQKVVKVFGREETSKEEFFCLSDALCKAQISAQFKAGIMGPITHQLCNMIYAITAGIGGVMVIKYGFDIGGLTVSLNYTRQFNRPINEISMQMNTVFAALAGAERVFEVMDMEPEMESENTVNLDKITGFVELKNVNFGYTKDKLILKDISLYAKPGQKIAFVGSTGAGKTTVTNLLSRFYDIDSGEITIDGHPIEKINRFFLRQNIAMVLQDTHLFSGTVRENIRYGRLDATDEEVIAAAKAASAHTFIMQLENGYDTVLENDGANLSQGQRQLLNIARAAISHAPILILDEATSSVDTRTEKMIDEGMDRLMENRTTFVIAHRLSTVKKANAIMVLENGRIIERGTHKELLDQKGRYYNLHNEIIQLD